MTRLRVALLGDERDLELVGAQGDFSWGEIALGRAHGALTVEFVRGAATVGEVIAWRGDTASVGREGEAIWRRLPWPAGTRPFTLSQPAQSAALIAGPREHADPIAARLRERGVAVDQRDRVTLEALEAASVVCLPVPDRGPPPGETMAVLAAGRILVTRLCNPGFGLEPGIECFMESSPEPVAQRVEAAVRWPDAFGVTRALGRLAAAHHRVDVLLHRLAVDAACGVS